MQPRAIDESEVARFPPHVREIWMYLLRKANHRNDETSGLKRGQLITSYSEIIEDLSWFVGYRKESYKKHHCGTAMRVLTKEAMITTTKTTRGLIITICKYDHYQSPENYETNTETNNEQTGNKQWTSTINKNDKNDKNDKKNREGKSTRFIPPSVEEIKNYCEERKNNISADKFFDFYQAKNWMIGKNKMKDWRASVRTWERRNENNGKNEDRQTDKDAARRTWLAQQAADAFGQ